MTHAERNKRFIEETFANDNALQALLIQACDEPELKEWAREQIRKLDGSKGDGCINNAHDKIRALDWCWAPVADISRSAHERQIALLAKEHSLYSREWKRSRQLAKVS